MYYKDRIRDFINEETSENVTKAYSVPKFYFYSLARGLENAAEKNNSVSLIQLLDTEIVESTQGNKIDEEIITQRYVAILKVNSSHRLYKAYNEPQHIESIIEKITLEEALR